MADIHQGGFQVPGGVPGGQHHGSPLPGQGSGLTTYSSLFEDAGGINATNLALGVSPFHILPFAHYATRIWAILGVAESGADVSNYTTIEFRYGASFASYTVLGSVNTQANPGAGVPITKNIAPVRMQSGLLLYAVVTRTGTAVNFNLERITVGIDFQGVRVA